MAASLIFCGAALWQGPQRTWATLGVTIMLRHPFGDLLVPVRAADCYRANPEIDIYHASCMTPDTPPFNYPRLMMKAFAIAGAREQYVSVYGWLFRAVFAGPRHRDFGAAGNGSAD